MATTTEMKRMTMKSSSEEFERAISLLCLLRSWLSFAPLLVPFYTFPCSSQLAVASELESSLDVFGRNSTGQSDCFPNPTGTVRAHQLITFSNQRTTLLLRIQTSAS